MDSHTREQEVVAKTPRRSRGQTRVTSLLDAAAVMFARDGYDAATMTEIAAKAGASIGSLYQFFPTKSLVADALYNRELDEIGEALGRATDEMLMVSCPLDVLADRLFVELLAFLASHPALVVVSDRRDAEAVRQARTRPGIRDQIAELLSRATPSPTSHRAKRVATIVYLLMKGSIIAQVNDDPESEDLIAELRAMLRNHLTRQSEAYISGD